jgi:hypothetical protein
VSSHVKREMENLREMRMWKQSVNIDMFGYWDNSRFRTDLQEQFDRSRDKLFFLEWTSQTTFCFITKITSPFSFFHALTYMLPPMQNDLNLPLSVDHSLSFRSTFPSQWVVFLTFSDVQKRIKAHMYAWTHVFIPQKR